MLRASTAIAAEANIKNAFLEIELGFETTSYCTKILYKKSLNSLRTS
jgi:hypothetical protein